MSVTIHVTQEDIDTGVPMNASACPLAKAAHRQGHHAALFAPDSAGFFKDDFDYYLSPKAKEFLEDFDHGGIVQPATFVLRRRVR